jgi:hypothetical protein
MQRKLVQVAAETKRVKYNHLAGPRGYLETIFVRAIRKVVRLPPASLAEEDCLSARLHVGEVEENGGDPALSF